jgi:glutamine synthetase
MEKEEILKRCKKEQVHFIHLQFSDLDGIVKSVEIPISQLKGALDRGKWFDGSSIEGFARIAESDMFLKPDLTTFTVIPWDDENGFRSARIICDVMTPDKKPFVGDPRGVLKKNMDEARKLGYVYNVGPELEFFLFRKLEDGGIDLSPTDSAGYFDYSDDWAGIVRKEIAVAAEQMGIEIETIHHEVSKSQHEIDFKYSDALTAADNVITLKFIIKAIADRYGLLATFMPKPVFGINGSGMHVHQSLWDKTGKNLFYDKKSDYGLSKLAKQFIAGQLKEASGICMVMSPLVNSYKRLVPGYEAPVYLSWARINRSALIRVPQFSSDSYKSARIELRSPDPSCNPYLAFSVMLAAGLSGVVGKLTPPDPIEENIYEMNEDERNERNISTLPDSLGSAILEFERSQLAENALGEHLMSRLTDSHKREWDEYRLRVSAWEIDQYLGKY